MQVTVSLNNAEAAKAVEAGAPISLPKLIGTAKNTKILEIFGRERFAKIETTPDDLADLRVRLGHLCLFSSTLDAQPFDP